MCCKAWWWCSVLHECDKEAQVEKITVLSQTHNLLFYLTDRGLCVCMCVCVSAIGAHCHLTLSATSITFYFQQSALLLIGIIYCRFMQLVLQVVQSLTPLLDFYASQSGAVRTLTCHTADKAQGTLFISMHLIHTLFFFQATHLSQFQSWENLHFLLC